MPANYPVGTDLEEFLGDLGVTITEEKADQYIATAIEDFESRTFRPFLAQDSSIDFNGEVLRSFDGYHYEASDMPFMADSLTVTITPIEGDPITLENRKDFFCLPMPGGVNLNPFRRLVLRRSVAQCHTVTLAGKFGFATSCPQNVWDAIIMRAAGKYLEFLRVKGNAANGGDGVKMIRSGSVTIEWFDKHESSFSVYFGEVCEAYC